MKICQILHEILLNEINYAQRPESGMEAFSLCFLYKNGKSICLITQNASEKSFLQDVFHNLWETLTESGKSPASIANIPLTQMNVALFSMIHLVFFFQFFI